MALGDVFLTPLGLLALASTLPLLLLYFLRPEPTRFAIPTIRFLEDDHEEETRNVVIETFRHNPLLFIQLLVLILISLALAGPYVTVSAESTIDETVLVIDASASMATTVDATTRFDRALNAARGAITGTTSVVVAEATPRVVLRRGTRAEAEQTLPALEVTHTRGSLDAAITQATAVAGPDARVIVFSDFADATGWRSSIETARARGYRVDLRQFAGGSNTLGITDYSFRGDEVTVSVRNFADRPIGTTVQLGDQSQSLSLSPGGLATATFRVPAGGGDLAVASRDGFPVDNTLPLAAPRDRAVDVVVVTNDENRFLTTALSLIDPVRVTVKEPPTTLAAEYDVVVFSSVAPDRVLEGTLDAARETVRRGGGVVVQAQRDVGAVGYGDLLLVNPRGVANASTVTAIDHPLTRDITFSPPAQYVRGDLRSGQELVQVNESPLVAIAPRSGGRIMYYGYIEESSEFKYNYRYPVFWKRAIFAVAGRASLAELNRETGTRLTFANETTVAAPTGTRRGSTVTLDRVGRYTIGERVVAAGFASEPESNVTAPPLGRIETEIARGPRTEDQRVPRALTPYVVFGVIAVVLVELAVLRRRGDL